MSTKVTAAYTKIPWKYALTEDFTYECKTGYSGLLKSIYYRIDERGMTVRAGYVWDGVSGPTLFTVNSIEPSLIHDVLYQAIREKQIPRKLRRRADKIFREALMQYGMSFGRRWAWYWAVRIFGRNAV